MIYLVTRQGEAFRDITPSIARCTLQEMFQYFQQHSRIAFDTETEGFCPYLNGVICSQFGDNVNQYVVDHSSIPMSELKTFMENPHTTWLMQNAKFDLRFLYRKNIVPKKVYDTFLVEKILTSGLRIRRALDYLVQRYCKATMDKEIRGVIHREGLTTRVIQYAANDVKFLHEIMDKQMVKVKNQGLEKAVQLDNMYVRVLAYIEYSGFHLDRDAWIRKVNSDLVKKREAEDALNNWIIENELEGFIDNQLDLFSEELKATVNWSSPKQVCEFMESLGVDIKTKDPKGGFKKSVDASVLKPQQDKFPVIPLYLEYKAAEKVCSTYGETFIKQINPISGRLHTTFTQIMNTGRLSSGGKNRATREEYINFQNIPSNKETRSCFTAEEGNTLIVADYSGQEQIVLANQSMDADILEFYDQAMGDMHSFVCSKIYPELSGIPLDEIKSKHKDKRQIAKAAGFAIN